MRRRELFAASLLLPLLVWTAFLPILHNSFVAEDFWQAQLWQLPAVWIKFVTLPGGGGYRPLMFASWAAAGFVWGPQPFPFRVVAVLGHLLNTALVYALARRLTRRPGLGLAAGALFAVFPTSAEAVNWLSAASNQILCAFGYLVGLRALIPFVTPAAPPRRWLWLSLGGLALALGSNEIGLSWPAAALIVCACLAPPGSFRAWFTTRLRRLWPLGLGWLLFLGWRTLAVRGLGGYGAAVHFRGGVWLWEALRLYLDFYLQPLRALWLDTGGAAWASLFADHRFIGTGLQWAAACVVSVAVGVLLWRARLLVALMLVMLVPAWTIPALHRGYLMGAGVALVVAAGLAGLPRAQRLARVSRWIHAGLYSLVALAVLAELRGTFARNNEWIATSRWVRQILSETALLEPNPAAGTVFYYYNLPQFYSSTYAFTWGLPQAVQQHYAEASLSAFQVYDTASDTRIAADLERSLAQVAQTTGPPQVYLVYAPSASGVLLSRVTRDEFLRLPAGPAP